MGENVAGRWRTVLAAAWRVALSAVAGALLVAVPGARAAYADDGIFSEVRLGVLDHDIAFAGGKEHGVDINGELTFTSPVPQELGASWPTWASWIIHPRPHIGIDANTAGATTQGYLGLTWTVVLASSLVGSTDRLEFNYLFGPSFNNGYHDTKLSDRKSLGSNTLFHLGGEIAYWVTPRAAVAIYYDHSSNGDLAHPNDSLNDLGLRVGYHF